mgnify:CR=1 FL=1
MSVKTWQPVKYCFCHHVDGSVALEAEVVYPSEVLPDQQPRVLAHRCSHGAICNLDGRVSCLWAGTNPAVDPFI